MRIGLGLLIAVVCGGSALGQTVAQGRLMDAPRTACSTPGGEWVTPAEKSCYATTPDYAETMTYLKRVQAEASAQVRIEAFGRTGEGRELDIVIASRDGVFDAAATDRAKRPIVLVQNAIHAGEMD